MDPVTQVYIGDTTTLIHYPITIRFTIARMAGFVIVTAVGFGFYDQSRGKFPIDIGYQHFSQQLSGDGNDVSLFKKCGIKNFAHAG